ncbi:MAG: type II secretion system protein GspE, partial [Alphaproteobacteria bacterium]|nr:type II secretion system protein GspE [Alphaproteobacteria bacterium]
MAALEQAEFEDRADGFARELVARAKLTPEALARARQACRETGERLEHVLTRLGLMGERDLAEAMAAHLGLPVVGLSDLPVMPLLEEALKRSFLHDKLVLPLQERDDAVVVAMVHPLDDFACEAVRFAAGKPVARTVITPADFEIGYARLYGEGKSEIRRIAEESADAGEAFGDDVDRLKDVASEAPVVRLVNHLITRAVELRASDIHIEPMGAELRIRYRIDGVLQPVESPPPHLAPLVISRIKIM